MELKDGSEQIRIKKEMAEKLRKEAEELDMSVPETLYFMMNIYFHVYKKKKTLVDIGEHPQILPMKKETNSLLNNDNEEDGESYQLSLD